MFICFLLSAPSVVSPVSGPTASCRTAVPQAHGPGRPLQSLLGSSLPPEGRINYASSIPDVSPQVICSGTPLFLYLSAWFSQFKPITPFPLHVGTQNRASPPSPCSICRLLCPCPTTTEMPDASALLLTITLLWIFSSWLTSFWSTRCNIKQNTSLEALPGSKIGKKKITMSFGNGSFYTFQGGNCTFCNSTDDSCSRCDPCSPRTLSYHTAACAHPPPPPPPPPPWMQAAECSLRHMPPLNGSAGFQMVPSVFEVILSAFPSPLLPRGAGRGHRQRGSRCPALRRPSQTASARPVLPHRCSDFQ